MSKYNTEKLTLWKKLIADSKLSSDEERVEAFLEKYPTCTRTGVKSKISLLAAKLGRKEIKQKKKDSYIKSLGSNIRS